jgi:hypothetical protein
MPGFLFPGVSPISPDSFCTSARQFARDALEAHHAQRYPQVALHAATTLEHLAKACLAKRSPALLTELRNGKFESLLWLLGIPAAKPGPQRTVGCREALDRVANWVSSNASDDDLKTLIGMRDGTVHAALYEEVEEQLLVAFAQHADALLADFGERRIEFWGDHLAVVDALLANESDRVAHRVAVKLAAARAAFQRRYAGEDERIIAAVLAFAEQQGYTDYEELAECPACEAHGVVSGDFSVEYGDPQTGDVSDASGTVWFKAKKFGCRTCGLRLDSPLEMSTAGLSTGFPIEGADPRDYMPSYDEWRASRIADGEEWPDG